MSLLSNNIGPNATTDPTLAPSLNVTWADEAGTQVNTPTGGVLTLGSGSMPLTLLRGGTGQTTYSGYEGIIDARDYAIDPTGVAASDVALNLAIQDAITQKKKLIIPSGLFVLNAPLLAYKGLFSSVQIEGQGGADAAAPPPYSAAVYNPNTILYTNYTDKPAIIFNANRNCVLKNLAICGQNVAPTNLAIPSPNRANYVTSGCRDSQYSPYCAICIDPFCGNTPGDGGYPGLTAKYGAAVGSGSHGMLFDEVFIQQFVVGVMSQPTPGALNGDVCEFRNMDVDYCSVSYAWGQSQARANVVRGGQLSGFQTAFDNVSYGQGTAPPPFVYDIQGSGYALLNYVMGTGPGLFSGVYLESQMTLGQVHGGNCPLTFTCLHFSSGYAEDVGWVIPPLVLVTYCPTSFKGCTFASPGAAMEAWNFAGVLPIEFDHCQFIGSASPRQIPHIGVTLGGANVVRLRDCFVNNGGYGGANQVLSDDYLRYGNGLAPIDLPGGRLDCTFQTSRVCDGSVPIDYVVEPPALSAGGATIRITGVTALTLNASTVTFTTTVPQYLMVGDVLTWTMLPQAGVGIVDVPALTVTAIAGNNVTCSMLFDPAFYDTVAHQSNGSGAVFACIHLWVPTQNLTCTTNTSTALTSVSPVNTLTVGDLIIGFGTNAADIPTNCRVTATDGAGNVTISHAAAGSHSAVQLCCSQLNQVTLTAVF